MRYAKTRRVRIVVFAVTGVVACCYALSARTASSDTSVAPAIPDEIKAIFAQKPCLTCHKLGKQGVAKRRHAADLVELILRNQALDKRIQWAVCAEVSPGQVCR